MPKPVSIPAPQIQRAVDQISRAIARRHERRPPFALLGIANGGIPFAHRLAARLRELTGRPIPVGTIDISFYRDDIGARPIPRIATPTDVPGAIDGASFILADDVLHSGRTIRAALEELFAQGRPDRVELAVLVDRGDRRLPVAADYIGFALDVTPGLAVRVRLSSTPAGSDAIRLERGD